jgi:nucleoid-associated protein Lsr2
MVRKVEVRLVDDLDSGPAEETVRFGLDGVYYEIDLSSKHAKELRAGLERYLAVATRVAQNGRSAQRSRGRTGAAGVDNQVIREWAASRGLEVAPRGRIPRAVLDQYEADASRSASGRRSRA